MNDRRAVSNPAVPNCTDATLPDTPALRSDRLYRLRKFGYLWKVAAQALRNGVPLRDYARMAAPLFLRGTSRLPHALYLEFSNVCNTVCEYCPYPAYGKALPFMRRDVFARILGALSEVPVNKIHVGGGEPTLHPHFSAWLRELRGLRALCECGQQWTMVRRLHRGSPDVGGRGHGGDFGGRRRQIRV
ncbi:MAG: radical SAM protein [Ignavibacteria bacterium]|nr:radical SAM protein [Ignavibacteria bacterium]